RAGRAAALDPGLQNSARRRRLREGRIAGQGNSLHLRLAAAWREQARFHGGVGLSGARACETDPRRGFAALPAVRDGRLDRGVRAFRRALHRAARVSRAVRGGAGLRRVAGDDQQLHSQQFPHLSRSAAEGFCDPARTGAVLSRLWRRPRRQCRRGVLGLRAGADLVAGGRGRRADGRGVELRDVRTVRLAQAMTSSMGPRDARLARNTILTVLSLVLLRLVAAAFTPLTFDEAYYWTWSKHLAGGYYDHPPMVAIVIRLGTMIAGDTELGVRLVSILLALPMSFAVYRTAEILFGGKRVAATATILINVTLMAAVGT